MTFWTELERHGDALALIEADGTRWSYTDLAKAADNAIAAATSLLPPTVTRPLVLLEASNDSMAIVAYLAVLRAGWPVILTNKANDSGDDRIIATYRPNLIFTSTAGQSGFRMCDASPAEMHPELAVLLSTSGTTGAPKLVRLSAGNIGANAEAISRYLNIAADDRAITTLEFYYSYGMAVLNSHLHAGAAIILNKNSLVENDFWQLARQHGATSLALVPFQFELLDRVDFSATSLPTLRTVTQAGGKLAVATILRYAALGKKDGWRLFVMYGQTEAGPRMAYVPPHEIERYPDCIGRAIPGGRFEIIGADGALISETQTPGQLIYSGPNVMMGYATARADLGNPAGGRPLHTGDIAVRLENGYYRITGRHSRFLKLFGLRIGLDEIEQVLGREGITAYCTGSDEHLAVFVSAAADVERVRQQIARKFKLPPSSFRVGRLETVPLLPSGKINYAALKSLAETLSNGEAGHTPLADDLARALRIASINPNLSFAEHGGDSLAFVEAELLLSAKHGRLPPGWELLPLAKFISSLSHNPAGGSSVGTDILCRVAAILGVVLLHASAWPVSGGTYLLTVLAGHSIARFQMSNLLAGNIFRVLATMLVPIVTSYYVILVLCTLLWKPVDPGWFLLVGNFDARINPKGIEPYWFVCLYTQLMFIICLPFASARFRRAVGRFPFVSGICVIALSVLAVELIQLVHTFQGHRIRNPFFAIQLVALGWCIYHAKTTTEKIIATLLLLALTFFYWSVSASVIAFLLTGVAVLIWIGELPLPASVAQVMRIIGSASMFIYLAHVIVIFAVTQFLGSGTIASLAVSLLLSAAAGVALKALHGRIRFADLLLQFRESRFLV